MKAGPGGWYIHPYEMAVCGFKNSGKTTLLRKLVEALVRQGLDTACLKSDAHHFDLDHAGKDTDLLRRAGASAVGIVDKTRSGWILDHPFPPVADQVLVEHAFITRDALLVEGRKHSPLPKLVMWDERGEMRKLMEEHPLEAVLAVVGSVGVEAESRDWAERLAIPYWDRDQAEAITEFIRDFWRERTPVLRGLVLAGGLSTRMGEDKSLLSYGGRPPEPQRLAEMLAPLCASVHLSCRADQTIPGFDRREQVCEGLPTVLDDMYLEMGPLGGLLTALDADAHAAWLVVSCDLPLLEGVDLAHLIKERRPHALGSAFATPWDGVDMPEPLCAIWEPKARPRLLGLLARGVKCPRWALRAGGAHYVKPLDPACVLNANHPSDRIKALDILARR